MISEMCEEKGVTLVVACLCEVLIRDTFTLWGQIQIKARILCQNKIKVRFTLTALILL